MTTDQNSPWFTDKLRFDCTGCGDCCSGPSGYIWVNDDEIQGIANYLGLELQEFADKYLKKVGKKFSLREVRSRKKKRHYDCVFLKDKKCTVYSERPVQCRTFPFWNHNIVDEQSWKDAAKYCEGINDQAPIIDNETILSQAEETEAKSSLNYLFT